MFKKLFIVLLCVQLLLSGCTARTEKEKPEDKSAQTSAVEEEAKEEIKIPAEKEEKEEKEEPNVSVEGEVPKKEPLPPPEKEKTEEEMSKVMPQLTEQTTPPPVQEPAAPPPAPETPAEDKIFDVSLLDKFKEFSSLKITGFQRILTYEDGESFDPFIDDLKDILKDHSVTTLSEEEQRQQEDKNLQLIVYSRLSGQKVFVFDDMVMLEYDENIIFVPVDEETVAQMKALVHRTADERGPDLDKKGPEKADPSMGSNP